MMSFLPITLRKQVKAITITSCLSGQTDGLRLTYKKDQNNRFRLKFGCTCRKYTDTARNRAGSTSICLG
jgi:hypothetical protein